MNSFLNTQGAYAVPMDMNVRTKPIMRECVPLTVPRCGKSCFAEVYQHLHFVDIGGIDMFLAVSQIGAVIAVVTCNLQKLDLDCCVNGCVRAAKVSDTTSEIKNTKHTPILQCMTVLPSGWHAKQ